MAEIVVLELGGTGSRTASPLKVKILLKIPRKAELMSSSCSLIRLKKEVIRVHLYLPTTMNLCPRQSHRTLLLGAPLLGHALAKVPAVSGKPFYAASTNFSKL
jgi:hypothetical protein